MSTAAGWPPTEGPVIVDVLEDGAVWRVTLATPKANVLDSDKIRALTSVFERAAAETGLKAVLLAAQGPHFSFGASVEEHLPDRVEQMLRDFHSLFGRMLDASVPMLAAVQGRCLGGGLELATFCHRVFASPEARLGQPEIRLGVFAPVASVVLPERIGRGRADDLCLSGRSVDAEEAVRIGLVDEIAQDPEDAALGYARAHLAPCSASSLRFAVRAARASFADRFRVEIERAERLYLDDLMNTRDAVEGIRAFVEKRDPAWTDS